MIVVDGDDPSVVLFERNADQRVFSREHDQDHDNAHRAGER